MGQSESQPVDEILSQRAGVLWSVLRSKSFDDEDITVFEHRRGSDQAAEDGAAQALKHLRSLRHPSILLFQWCQEDDDIVSIITEPALPLEMVAGNQPITPAEVALGLKDLLEALQFLAKNGLSHNRVCASSIYVSCSSNAWKLGDFALCKEAEDCSALYFQSMSSIHPEECKCPEDKDHGQPGQPGPPGTRDALCFGKLVLGLTELLPSLSQDSSFTEFQSYCEERLLADDPEDRAPLEEILSHEYFSNSLVSTVQFLREITIQSPVAKTRFFRELPSRLRRMDENALGRVVLQQLLQPVLFTEDEYLEVLPSVLSPSENGTGFLTRDAFVKYAVPQLSDLLQSRDRQVRICLLQNVASYASLIDKETLESEFVPEFTEGLKDRDQTLFSETLKALGVLAGICHVDLLPEKRRNVFSSASEACKFRRRASLEAQSASTTVSSPIVSSVSSAQGDEEKARKREERRRMAEERRRLAEERRLQRKAESHKIAKLAVRKSSPPPETPKVAHEPQLDDGNDRNEAWSDHGDDWGDDGDGWGDQGGDWDQDSQKDSQIGLHSSTTSTLEAAVSVEELAESVGVSDESDWGEIEDTPSEEHDPVPVKVEPPKLKIKSSPKAAKPPINVHSAQKKGLKLVGTVKQTTKQEAPETKPAQKSVVAPPEAEKVADEPDFFADMVPTHRIEAASTAAAAPLVSIPKVVETKSEAIPDKVTKQSDEAIEELADGDWGEGWDDDF